MLTLLETDSTCYRLRVITDLRKYRPLPNHCRSRAPAYCTHQPQLQWCVKSEGAASSKKKKKRKETAREQMKMCLRS